MEKRVNILGVQYTVVLDANPDDMPDNADGSMDQSLRKIFIAKMAPSKSTIQNMDEYKKKVLRHEIIHAFFYESGLWNESESSGAFAQNEMITDWFAIQSPKIYKACREVGCL